MTRPSLIEMCEQHSGKQSDKWAGYLEFYEKLFSSFRHRQLRLLEIGVQNGGSLEIWANYFANAKQIVGCDIEPACGLLAYDDSRVQVVVGDAAEDSTRSRIAEISDQFDIVIDDGSHISGDIIRSFCIYFEMLTPGGIFVAEDLHCSYWSEYAGGLHHPASSIAFFKTLVDLIHSAHWGLNIPEADLLKPFRQHYGGLKFDPAEIASVEFVDSVCVIKKCKAGDARVGVRLVRGDETLVQDGLDEHDGLPNVAPEQHQNPYAVSEQERHQQERDELQAILNEARQKFAAIHSAREQEELQLAQYQQAVESLRASLSWRITAPLRRTLDLAYALAWRPKYLLSLFRLGGGLVASCRLLAKVTREEGWEGVRWRLDNARALTARAPSPEEKFTSNDYHEWIRRYDTLHEPIRERMRRRIKKFKRRPTISVVMPVYNPPPRLLEEAIQSVRNQIYPFWELCIADDASLDSEIQEILERHAGEDIRIKVLTRKENGHISAASNSALELVTGEYVALLDHDDLLAEHALFWVAEILERNKHANLIYSDEDKICLKGLRSAPYFKSDFNYELFLSQNMISHLGVYRTDLIKTIGGFRHGFEGAQDYDLALRCIELLDESEIVHIPRVLYHWRVHPQSTSSNADAKPYAMIAGERALNEHLTRIGVSGGVELLGWGYRVRYQLPDVRPLVSIVIPTRDRLELLKTCIEGIDNQTAYRPIELIVVDNGSSDPSTKSYLSTIDCRQDVQVLRDSGDFNFSRLNNLGVHAARGDLVCLLNSDIQVIESEWLGEMVSIAVQEGVGVVGAKLLYADKTIQHAGVILGLGAHRVAGHYRQPQGFHGYFGRSSLRQSFSAVTAACMMVRKEIWDEVSGFDPLLSVAYNDVDFCLRVSNAGWRNVWTPYACLIHHESKSRGAEESSEKQVRFEYEVEFMQRRWGQALLRDPAYNPNLTLDHDDFSLAWPPRV